MHLIHFDPSLSKAKNFAKIRCIKSKSTKYPNYLHIKFSRLNCIELPNYCNLIVWHLIFTEIVPLDTNSSPSYLQGCWTHDLGRWIMWLWPRSDLTSPVRCCTMIRVESTRFACWLNKFGRLIKIGQFGWVDSSWLNQLRCI